LWKISFSSFYWLIFALGDQVIFCLKRGDVLDVFWGFLRSWFWDFLRVWGLYVRFIYEKKLQAFFSFFYENFFGYLRLNKCLALKRNFTDRKGQKMICWLENQRLHKEFTFYSLKMKSYMQKKDFFSTRTQNFLHRE
jgi:hypothetical protein